MCGIVGVIAYKDSKADLFNLLTHPLKQLEHRGYDSWGVYCQWNPGSNTEVFVHRIVDTPVEEVRANYKGVFGLAHTRWATHGVRDMVNCQPVTNSDWAVVHNGTITNIDDISESHTELSDTVRFTRLLESSAQKYRSPIDIFIDVTQSLEGDNLIVAHHFSENRLFLYRSKGSDKNLYVGFYSEPHVGRVEGYTVFASEPQALSALGMKSCYPVWNSLDYQTVQVMDNAPDWHLAYDGHIESIPVPEFANDFDEDHMAREIREQKHVYVPNHLLRRQSNATPVIVGSGSSYNAALFGRRVFERLVGKPAICEYSSEFQSSELYHTTDYEVIGISQSGETHDTLATVDDKSTCIVNNKDSAMARKCGTVIPLGVGPEKAVAATKTFTASCLAVMEYALTWSSPQLLGEYQVLLKDPALSEWFDRVIENSFLNKDKLGRVYDRYLFLGTNYNYPIVREAALKMKEVAYIPSEGMPASEMKHGPIALVDKNCLSVFLITERNKQVWNNVNEIRSRGGDVLLIVRQDIYEEMSPELQLSSLIIPYSQDILHYSEEVLLPIVSLVGNVFCQQLAYNVAVAQGLNPSRPRNLAKTCTV